MISKRVLLADGHIFHSIPSMVSTPNSSVLHDTVEGQELVGYIPLYSTRVASDGHGDIAE